MCTQPTPEFLALEIHYSTNIYRCIYLNNMLFKKKKKRICCSVSRTKPTPGDAKRREPKPVLRTEGRKTWLKLAGTTPVEVLWGARVIWENTLLSLRVRESSSRRRCLFHLQRQGGGFFSSTIWPFWRKDLDMIPSSDIDVPEMLWKWKWNALLIILFILIIYLKRKSYPCIKCAMF